MFLKLFIICHLFFSFNCNAKGKTIKSAYREFKQYYPKPGWVEHDAEEIWNTVSSTVKKVIKKLGF